MSSSEPETLPSFEESMDRLESIVDAMESSDLPLDSLLSHYEEGMKLVRICGEQLKEAEKRIEFLTASKNAPPSDESTEVSADPIKIKKTPKKKTNLDEEDEIRLF